MSDSDSADSDAEAGTSANGLSSYEQKRLDQIAKNREMLESLGLLDGGNLVMKRGPAVPREKKERVWEKRELPQRALRRAPERMNMTALGGKSNAPKPKPPPEPAVEEPERDPDAPFLPPCPECEGPSKADEDDPRWFVCLDPLCAHEWKPIVCGVCGQPKKGHTCSGRPKLVPEPPPPPPPEASRLQAACEYYDEVMTALSTRQHPSSTGSEFVASTRRAARLKRQHTELVRSGALEHMQAEAKKALKASPLCFCRPVMTLTT